MKFPIRLCFLVAALGAVSAQVKRYFKVGDELSLPPQAASAEITSITWKSNGDTVAEWVKDKIPLEYFSRFKGHASLDLASAVLTLSDMAAAHAGAYTVEINFQVQSQSYDVEQLQLVPTPVVDVQPLACNKESSNCTLICAGPGSGSGSGSGLGPVKYSWKWSDADWSESGDKLVITNTEETTLIENYFCRMENPVSLAESGPFKNPFYVSGTSTGAVVSGVFSLIAVVVVVVVAVGWWKKDMLMSACGSKEPKPTDNGAQPHEGDHLNEADNP